MNNTEKKIEDYLHLYLGCDMINIFSDIWQLTPEYYAKWVNNNHKAKPILRHLSDMTDEECGDVYTISRDTVLHESSHDFHIIKNENGFMIHRLDWLNEPLMLGFNGQIYSVVEDGNKKHIEPVRNQHEITKYLLSKHFDLFNLIESGLAIDKNKID